MKVHILDPKIIFKTTIPVNHKLLDRINSRCKKLYKNFTEITKIELTLRESVIIRHPADYDVRLLIFIDQNLIVQGSVGTDFDKLIDTTIEKAQHSLEAGSTTQTV